MAEILKGLPPENNPNLLVGFNKADDAGVYRIDDRRAVVQTVGFFPPIVDNPYHFGQIAGANANREYLEARIQLSGNLSKAQIDLLYDAQTSGGLFVAIPDNAADNFSRAAERIRLAVSEIGTVVKRDRFAIYVD